MQASDQVAVALEEGCAPCIHLCTSGEKCLQKCTIVLIIKVCVMFSVLVDMHPETTQKEKFFN